MLDYLSVQVDTRFVYSIETPEGPQMYPAHWWVGTTNRVRVRNLRDPATQAYVNDATVTGRVIGPAGEVVAAGISFAYITGSDGIYVGDIPAATALVDGANYTLEITAVKGTDVVVIRLTRQAAYRGEA